jgi:ABC-type amino acid transport substrate-binding protein
MRFLVLFFSLMVISLSAWADDGLSSVVFDRIQKTQTIRCGYVVYPPFIKMDVNTKKLSGLTVETMEAIGRELGYKIEWAEELSISSAFETINMGRYDMFCAPGWVTAPRIKVSIPTTPLYYDGYFAFVRAGDTRFSGGYDTINSESVRVSIQEGAAIQHLVTAYFPKAKVMAQPSLVDPTVQLTDVMTKKADVAFLEMTTFKDFDKLHPGKVQRTSVDPFMVMPAALWVPNKEVRLKMLLDDSILILQSNGTMAAFLEKYGGRKIFSYVRAGHEPTVK